MPASSRSFAARASGTGGMDSALVIGRSRTKAVAPPHPACARGGRVQAARRPPTRSGRRRRCACARSGVCSMSCGCVPWRGRACDKAVARAIKSSLPACRFPIRFHATATRLQRGDACSVLRKTAFSPRWVRERRWVSCCAATGCRSAAPANSTANPIKPIRLMGEDLVLYKDLGGQFGLLDRHCPHRRADLSYGFVEQTGIRCNYHGWLMDEAGRCIEQPYDDTVNPRSRAKERCAHQGLSGEGMRRPAVGLYGTAAGARAPGLGAVHLGERLSRGRALRRPLQLVSVPGELLRSRALRMDARQLDPSAERQDRSLCQQASQAQVRGVRLRLHLQARARGLRRAQSVLDRGPDRAVAERLLSRQPFRMARAGR